MIALWFGTFTEWDRVIQSQDGEFGTMDKVWEVDKGKKSMRVEAGISVQQLVDGIKDFGLALQNFASIREQYIYLFIYSWSKREQKIGGIVQMGFFLVLVGFSDQGFLFLAKRVSFFILQRAPKNRQDWRGVLQYIKILGQNIESDV